jgi:cyclopropane fatty-acyl-phospholipid synthase-like methyltransferase
MKLRGESVLDFPATHRNREAIAQVLGDQFPPEKPLHVLEVASGSGQHAVYWAQRFPNWTFQPSDLEPEHLVSIDSYREFHQVDNVLPAVSLDVAAEQWPLAKSYDVVLAVNLIHISPWECTVNLFEQSPSYLAKDGRVVLYGAYRRQGEHTSESNRLFHRSLQESDPSWGVRCLDEVAEVARVRKFQLEKVVEMPANNLTVVFKLL